MLYLLSGLMIYVQRLALVFWLGEMLFFIAIFAPRVFKVLPREMAGQLQANIFPAYYTAGIICAAIIFAVQIFYFRFESVRSFMGWRLILPVILVLGAGLIFLYSRSILVHKIAHLQPAVLASPAKDSPEAIEFARLHRLSVQVNGVALVLLLVLLGVIF